MSARGTRRVVLGEFAFEALAGERGEAGAQVPSRLVRAIRSYLGDRDAGRPGWRYPGFLSDRRAGESVGLEVSIDDDLWRSLEEEAGRQGVSMEQMVNHAALYFGAEVNAGRATQRILDGLENDVAEENGTPEKPLA
ncbi:MAG: hypothetical protein WBM00_01470 [Solirubrobacterales bacterium]